MSWCFICLVNDQYMSRFDSFDKSTVFVDNDTGMNGGLNCQGGYCRISVKLWTNNDSFFHFSWNSLPQVHVFFRAQEKSSSLRKSTKNACHAHARPFHTKKRPKNVRKKTYLGKEIRIFSSLGKEIRIFLP